MKTLVDLGARLFPDREITVTSGNNSHAIALPGPVQAAIGLALILGFSSTAAVAYRSIEAHRAIVRERAIVIAQLKAELADVQGQAAKAEQTLVQLASLAQPNATADTDDLSHADPAELGEKINERIAALEAQLQTLNAQKESLASDRERAGVRKGQAAKERR